MRIDVVVKYFHPVVAGIETNILETYSHLARRNWRVNIHTSQDTYQEPGSLCKYETVRGLAVHRYPFVSENVGFSPAVDWQNSRLVCLHNFNVFFWRLLLRITWLKLTGRKKFALVITPHGGFTPEWSIFKNFWVRIAKQAYHLTLGVFFLNFVADAIRAVSDWEKAELVRYGVNPRRIVVIANGVEDEAFGDVNRQASGRIKRLVKTLGRYLIQVGRVYPIKNYETAIRALSLVPGGVKYVIVGPVEDRGSYLSSLHQLISRLGLRDRVVFAGVVRGVDKFYLIRHARAMVHMAIWESFCNVVHEALSQRVPCLVADNTALSYVVKNGVNGFLVGTYDWRALAKRINSALRNPSRFKFAVQPTWVDTATKMHRLYTKLAKNYD